MDQEDRLGTSKLINEANKQLTRTCVVVTIIFILSLGMHVYIPLTKDNQIDLVYWRINQDKSKLILYLNYSF